MKSSLFGTWSKRSEVSDHHTCYHILLSLSTSFLSTFVLDLLWQDTACVSVIRRLFSFSWLVVTLPSFESALCRSKEGMEGRKAAWYTWPSSSSCCWLPSFLVASLAIHSVFPVTVDSPLKEKGAFLDPRKSNIGRKWIRNQRTKLELTLPFFELHILRPLFSFHSLLLLRQNSLLEFQFPSQRVWHVQNWTRSNGATDPWERRKK